MDWRRTCLRQLLPPPASQPTRQLEACSKSQAEQSPGSTPEGGAARSAACLRNPPYRYNHDMPSHFRRARQSAGAVDRTAGLRTLLLVDHPSPQQLPGSGKRTSASKHREAPKPAAKELL